RDAGGALQRAGAPPDRRGAPVHRRSQSRRYVLEPASHTVAAARPRVVIVGAGFGGLSAAKALAGTAVDVTLIDRENHHLFQPLLYQVATAGLSPADIAAPIRSIVGNKCNITVLLGEVGGVDTASRTVRIGARQVPYDFLVLATGARHAYFGH